MNEQEQFPLTWSQLYKHRRDIRKRFSSIWNLPIKKKVLNVLKDVTSEEASVLDVGSCNRNLEGFFKEQFSNVKYKSMDVDKKSFHDFYSMEEINESFDLVVMFECIEHLTLEQGYQTLIHIHRILKDNGTFLISTPNTFHPNRYWECTHKVPFRYDELGGFINLCGFETESIFRIYNNNFLGKLFRLYVAAPIHKYFDIDFAKSILVVGKKVPKGS